ncbi:histone deacetylase 7-like isoform X1 [Lates japonicus]|uniref:Histone deacetylase 7-like isoform X1 n=1 Tax=Lates japonicus TaxID=270547 RepID=A0AAD3N364_LATJO|nr:histone deacetylase 7-like isoform X1 [Lates japonicus]
MSAPKTVDVIISSQVSLSMRGEQPMDLSVTQRLLHPGSDSAMLAPRPPFFLGPLTPQHCSQFSQQRLQYNMEQRPREMEEEKREELQQLIRKNKNEQSAVASPLVRQKLREHIIMKSQPSHDRVTPNHTSPTSAYRLPVPDMSPNPQPTPCDQRKDLALRRTVSEPTLKWKLKKLISARPNPLQRKISAPPAVKHRTETLVHGLSHSSAAAASPDFCFQESVGNLPSHKPPGGHGPGGWIGIRFWSQGLCAAQVRGGYRRQSTEHRLRLSCESNLSSGEQSGLTFLSQGFCFFNSVAIAAKQLKTNSAISRSSLNGLGEDPTA